MILIQQKISKEEKVIVLLRMSNSSGAYVDVTNIGASIVGIVVADKDGVFDNVVLNYTEIESYLTDNFYLGATIGRYANRISGAKFALDGMIHELDRNDGRNSNHGGFNGFNKQIFDYEIGSESITFSIESPDGEGGFPGNLRLSVTYTFSDDNELLIEYSALSDKATPVNFTNHTYFNLLSSQTTIWNHELKINALCCLEMNEEFLPTGEIMSVADSAFDFSHYASVGEKADQKNDNMKGYNAFYIKVNQSDINTPLASLRCSESGRIVDVYTSMSGIQIYTGDFLTDQFIPFGGICLEAQYHPDGVNHGHFEKNILSPNIEKKDIIKFRFLS